MSHDTSALHGGNSAPMSDRNMTQGPNCPKCGLPMERRDAQFFWRGDYRPGYVCVSCNALWPVPGEEIAPLRWVPTP